MEVIPRTVQYVYAPAQYIDTFRHPVVTGVLWLLIHSPLSVCPFGYLIFWWVSCFDMPVNCCKRKGGSAWFQFCCPHPDRYQSNSQLYCIACLRRVCDWLQLPTWHVIGLHSPSCDSRTAGSAMRCCCCCCTLFPVTYQHHLPASADLRPITRSCSIIVSDAMRASAGPPRRAAGALPYTACVNRIACMTVDCADWSLAVPRSTLLCAR